MLLLIASVRTLYLYPIRYKKYCPSCDKEISNEDIIKGYEYEEGKYVTFTQDELEKIKTKKDKTIHVEHFAKMSEIDSLLYDKNYYLMPEPGAEKAYELLRYALLTKKEVAVAKTVIGTNENLIVIYPTKECLIAKVLYYQEEIQEMPDEYQARLKDAIMTKINGNEIMAADSGRQDNIIDLMDALKRSVELAETRQKERII